MATQFEDLFDEFLDTEISSLDLSRYTPPNLSKYLTNLLKRAREEFYNYAYSDKGIILNKMDDVVEFYIKEYSYINNSGSSTFTTILNPIPVSGSSFYITVNDLGITNYSYDSNTGTITINNIGNQSSINIICFKNGEFNQNLNLVEFGILIDLMSMTFIKDKIKEQRLYNMAISGRDEGMGSQANHLRSLNEIYNDTRKDVMQKMYLYTYQNSPS